MIFQSFMIGLLGIIFQVYASEIADIDEVRRQKLTCKLFRAVLQGGLLEDIASLVIDGADINAQDISGASLCHHASLFNRYDVLEILCKQGADLNIKDNDGNTPLHYASRYGAYRAVKTLLIHGANKWEKNDKSRTSIELAQKSRRKLIVELIENWHDPFEIKEPSVN